MLKNFRKIGVPLRYCAQSALKEKVELPLVITPDSQYDVLSDIVTPLHRIEYKDQLQKKKKWTKTVVENIKLRMPIKSKTKFHNIIPSPKIDSYRNKDEFNLRNGIDGNPKTVGFFVGSPAEGETFCVPPDKLKNLKPTHVELARAYQDFIRDSKLKACHDLHDGGFWRGFLVRSNLKGDHMIVVHVHPNGATESEKDLVRKDIVEHFRRFETVKSIFYQECPHTRCTHDTAPFHHLHGDTHIFEKIGEHSFRISPDSFFQINTSTAPFLYKSALSFLNTSDRMTLLDLCCGTGTLSILVSDLVRGCIGIEYVEQAIQDAQFNAKLNNAHNCYFFPGRIENLLRSALKHLEVSSDIGAVVNPGRAGIHRNALVILRDCLQLRNLVYISCKADSPNTVQNFADLCSKTLPGVPFKLTDVQPVDMFPHTNHCELVMHFSR